LTYNGHVSLITPVPHPAKPDFEPQRRKGMQALRIGRGPDDQLGLQGVGRPEADRWKFAITDN